MNNDNIKAEEWRNRVLELLQRLPEYNENDFSFEIDAGPPQSPQREQYFFVKKGKYCDYFYGRLSVLKKTTKNLKEAICWVLKYLISDYAVWYEKNHRIRYEDTRRQLFKIEQDMYDAIGEPYSEIKRKQQAKVLKQAPFDDTVICRINLVEDYEEIESWIKASDYKDMLKHFSSTSKLLALRREKKSIKSFEKLFDKSRDEISHFYNILMEIGEEDKLAELFELLSHCEDVAETHL